MLILLTVISISSASYFRWLTDIYGKNSGHTTCNFLTIPVSAVNIARGKASSPGSMDATDLPLFTANSALFDRYIFALSHTEWLFGLRKEYGAALFPVLDIGTYGFFTQVFTPGSINDARDINEQPSNPKMIEFSAGATFARSFLNKKINAGLAVSYIESRLDHISARTVNGTFDLLFITTPWISSRFYCANFSPGISYGTTREHLPLETGLSMLFSPLPTTLPLTSFFNFDIGIGLNKTADYPLAAGISTEIEAARYFYFRAGYEHDFGTSPSSEGLGLGIGFHKGVYGIDAGWRSQSRELGSVWSATMKIQLEEISPRTAKDYYDIALKHFRKNRYGLSTLYLKKAIRLDPNLWEAHTLLHRINSEILRNEKKEIALVYTGNLRGQLIPSTKPDDYGGIDRLATAVKNIRNQFPVSFAIESGNPLSPDPHPSRIELVKSYYEYMDFDAIVADVNHVATALHSSLLNLNAKSSIIHNSKPQRDYTVLEKDKYRIYVALLPDDILCDDPARFDQNKLKSPQALSCALRIAVTNSSWENIRKAAPHLQNADIILCSNLDHHFVSPVKIGNTILLSCGKEGKYAGNLIMRFDEEKKLISAENKIIPITSDIQSDPVIKELADNIGVKIELEKHGITDMKLSRENSEGAFVFQSDRDSHNGIYLKLPKKQADFRLSPKNINCSNVSLSFVSSKVAYTEENTECHTLVIHDLINTGKKVTIDSIHATRTVFSTDGKWVYFSGSLSCNKNETDIFKVRTDGGHAIPVVAWKGSDEHSMNFSHDTSRMVFCSDSGGVNHIFLTNFNGEDPIRITDVNGIHTAPSFSPDNIKIAYLSDRANFGGKLDLWIFDRNTGEHRQITANSDINSFCWLSDSRTIVYSSGISNKFLTRVDTKAYRFRKFTSNESGIYDDIDPEGIVIGGSEEILFTRKYRNDKRKLFRINTDGSGERCITDIKRNEWR